MQKGIHFLDKRASLMFYQKCHRSRNECVPNLRGQVPLLICHSNFTNILNQMFAKQILRPDECEIKKYLHDNAVGRNTAVKTLMDLLYVNKLKAQQIVNISLAFESMPRQNLIDNYEYLLSLGYDTETILKHVKVLAQSRQCLGKKIEYLKNVTDIRPENMDLNFFQYGMDPIRNFIKVYQSMNKKSSINDAMEDFAEKFEVDTDSVFKLVAANLLSMTSQPENTMRKLKILMDCGLSLEELCGSPKLSNNLSYKQLKDRIKILEENSMKVKLSKVNMREVMFNRLIQNGPKQSVSKTEYEQLVNYLSEKSGYSRLYMDYTLGKLSKHKLTFSNSLKTVNLLLDLGYDYEDIIYQPKLLTYSKETIRNQFNVPKSSRSNAI